MGPMWFLSTMILSSKWWKPGRNFKGTNWVKLKLQMCLFIVFLVYTVCSLGHWRRRRRWREPLGRRRGWGRWEHTLRHGWVCPAREHRLHVTNPALLGYIPHCHLTTLCGRVLLSQGWCFPASTDRLHRAGNCFFADDNVLELSV